MRSKADTANIRRVVSVVVTLLIWEWYGRGVDPLFFSYPTAIIRAVPEMIIGGDLPQAFASSMKVLAVGWSLSVVVGVALGLFMGRYSGANYLLDSQISALYAVPRVALIPLIILWFGLGFEAKITVVFLTAFFPLVINTRSGVRSVPRSLEEIGLAESASERQIFLKIIFPASFPYIIAGVRISVGRAVIGVVVAEMFTAINGLGGSIILHSNRFATDKMLVVVVVLVLLGVLLTQAVSVIEAKVQPWRLTERAR
jgi:NitT/TauT family transport system permease protein